MDSAQNNAAMREALEWLHGFGYVVDGEFRFPNTNMVKQRIDAALSEPLRNCDRFGDELDAQLAFLNEEWLISVDRDSMLEKDKFENWTDEMRSAYARWLMATMKGDNHAKND